jgi:hypothetical protein
MYPTIETNYNVSPDYKILKVILRNEYSRFRHSNKLLTKKVKAYYKNK